MLKFGLFAVVSLFVGLTQAQANFGVHAGVGIPFLSQYGLNYQFSDKFGVAATYNLLDLSSSGVSTTLSMPELMFNYHPFSGAFFAGLGVGQETLKVSATAINPNDVSIDVKATTMIAKVGWMWGIANRGFWFGVDYSLISPSGSTQSVTAPGVPTSDPDYIEALDAAKKFGETSFANLTFARIGWLF